MKDYVFEFAQYVESYLEPNSFGILGDLGRTSKFGEQTGYFKQLLKISDSLGIDAFIFTDFNSDKIVGWKYKEGKWISEKRGLPKVFYNRSFRKRPYLKGESSTKYLTNKGCKAINSAYFRKLALDKYLTYSELSIENLGELGIPYTEKYKDDKLIPFLLDHPNVILKPRFGSGGSGIIAISKDGNSYEVKYKDLTILCKEDELLDKIDMIRKKMKTSNRLYIIQEKINLPKYQNSVFDIRVIYQRNKEGKPLRTGMAARIASPNKITANLHQGGGRILLSSILQSLFNQDMSGEIAENIRTKSKLLFDTLNRKVGPIGEIGIDLLIDQNGKLHLIEVNSVPGRNLFKILPDIRKTAMRRPVEYAKYLLETYKK